MLQLLPISVLSLFLIPLKFLRNEPLLKLVNLGDLLNSLHGVGDLGKKHLDKLREGTTERAAESESTEHTNGGKPSRSISCCRIL